MPRFEITAPDGRRFEVTAPDGATEGEVLQYVMQNADSAPASGPKPEPRAAPTRMDRLITGLTDPLRAGEQILRHALPDKVVSALDAAGNKLVDMGLPLERVEGGAEGYDERLKELEAEYRDARDGDGVDWLRLAGNIISTAPIMAAGGGATLGAQAARGAVQGAAVAASQPATGESGFAGQKAAQAGVGAALGAAAPVAIAGAARVVKPATRDAVKLLQKAGVRLTPGQAVGGVSRATEEKAVSIPFTGDAIRMAEVRAIEDFNRAAINRALSPLGKRISQKSPVGHEAVARAHAIVDREYNRLVPHLKAQIDDQFGLEVRALLEHAQSLPPGRADQFAKIVSDDVLGRLRAARGGEGRAAKEVERRLGELIRAYGASADGDQRLMSGALRALQASFRGLLARSSPQAADDLAKVNSAYAALLRVEDAAARQGSKDGIFSPSALRMAVRALDSSARKRKVAHGDALLQDLAEAGEKVLGKTIPDSGTASRVATLATLGGGMAIDPAIPAAMGVGAAAYTPHIQRALVAMLTRRPESAAIIADAMRRASPVAAQALPATAERARRD